MLSYEAASATSYSESVSVGMERWRTPTRGSHEPEARVADAAVPSPGGPAQSPRVLEEQSRSAMESAPRGRAVPATPPSGWLARSRRAKRSAKPPLQSLSLLRSLPAPPVRVAGFLLFRAPPVLT